MSISPVDLKAELDLDPNGLAFTGEPFGDAAKMNERGLSGETIQVKEVPVMSAQAAVVMSEYNALSAGMQRAWSTLIGACGAVREDGTSGFPVKDPLILAQVLEVWAGGTTTRTKLAALKSRDASRGEILGEEDEVVTSGQITHARNLP